MPDLTQTFAAVLTALCSLLAGLSSPYWSEAACSRSGRCESGAVAAPGATRRRTGHSPGFCCWLLADARTAHADRTAPLERGDPTQTAARPTVATTTTRCRLRHFHFRGWLSSEPARAVSGPGRGAPPPPTDPEVTPVPSRLTQIPSAGRDLDRAARAA